MILGNALCWKWAYRWRGAARSVELLDRPADSAFVDDTRVYGWYKRHAGPLELPRQRRRRRPDHDGGSLEATGDALIACKYSSRVHRMGSSGSEINGESLTEPHYSLRIPRRGALEPVPVRL